MNIWRKKISIDSRKSHTVSLILITSFRSFHTQTRSEQFSYEILHVIEMDQRLHCKWVGLPFVFFFRRNSKNITLASSFSIRKCPLLQDWKMATVEMYKYRHTKSKTGSKKYYTSSTFYLFLFIYLVSFQKNLLLLSY